MVSGNHACQLDGTIKIIIFFWRILYYINTTGATSGAGTAYPSGEPEFTPGF